MPRERHPRTPKNPPLFWALFALCALIAAGSVALMAVRGHESSATAEAGR